MAEELTDEAYMVSHTLNPSRVRALKGDSSDQQNPAYLRLKYELGVAMQINPQWYRISLLSRRPDRTIFYQVDSKDASSPASMPPGTQNRSASRILEQVFDSGKSAFEKYSLADWGELLIAYVPVRDRLTGQILTVVCVEIILPRWTHLRAHLFGMPIILTVALLLLWLVGNALEVRRNRMGNWHSPMYRYLEAWLIFIAGLILTTAVAWTVDINEQWRLKQAFRRIYENDRNIVIQRAHNLRDLELNGIKAFIESSELVTFPEFQRYSSHLLNNPSVLFWCWVPRVESADRKQFEEEARALTGQPEYRIWAPDPSGNPEPAESDSCYYPILYIATQRGNMQMSGFDLGSDSNYRSAIESAFRDQLVMSSELEAHMLPGDDCKGLLVIEPVTRPGDDARLQGFVALGLDPHTWIDIGSFEETTRPELSEMVLYELYSERPPRWVASSQKKAIPDAHPSFQSWPDIHSACPLPLFGKQYALVAWPNENFYDIEKNQSVLAVCIIGLLITAGLAVVVTFIGQRRRFLYMQVDEQSRALELILQRYSQLEKQNRVMTWEANLDGLFLHVSNMVETLYGYPPEDVIRKKHFYDFLPEPQKEGRKELILSLFSRGEPIRNLRHPMVSRDGKIVWISTDGTPIRNNRGEVTGYWGTDTDITETKRTEDELEQIYQSNRDLVDRYQALIKASQTGAWEYNSDPAKMWESREYYEMLGLNPEEFGRSKHVLHLHNAWVDLIHPDDRKRAVQTFSDYEKHPEGIYEQVFRMRHADGRWLWILARGEALRDKNGQLTGAIMGTHTDITATKQAEEEIRESRRRYIALLGNLPGMVYRCKNDPQWTMEFASKGCVDLTGYAPEDLVGNRMTSYNDLIHPSFRQEVYDDWQRTLARRGPYEGEYKIVTRSGEEKWVWERGEGIFDDAGNVIALEGFIADITARKQAEFERERLSSVVEQSAETVVITDVDARIIYVNPAFTKSTGYTLEEARGKNPRVLKSGRHSADFYRQLWKTLLSGQAWKGEFINRRKDGTLYTELASIIPLRDASGQVVNYVAVKHDITEERKVQEEKDALQAQLHHSQKMDSMGRLAGGVAHDFNNMLQAILGYAEIALMQVPSDQSLHTDLEEIQRAARRAADLTRQLQVFARKKPMAPQVVDINHAIEGMCSMLKRLIGEHIQLTWTPGADAGRVTMDPGQLDQVVVNLAINARDAMDRSGSIWIETSAIHLSKSEASQLDEMPEGTYIKLTVRDNGSGIAPNVLENIFEPFFTTKPSGKGTGLGLATVYGIIKQNRGGIHVDTELGKGTTFTLYLPQVEEEVTERRPSAPAAVQPQILYAGTVLLVDDEPGVLQATRRILESLGYTVIATNSAEKALQLSKDFRGKIDVLITDVIMPGMSGPELVKQVLKLSPRLRTLYISGYTANLLEEQGIREEAENILNKPFNREALEKKLQELMAQR